MVKVEIFQTWQVEHDILFERIRWTSFPTKLSNHITPRIVRNHINSFSFFWLYPNSLPSDKNPLAVKTACPHQSWEVV